jgi:hypothetical protein
MPDNLDEVIAQYHAACTPFAKGDPTPVKELFSHADDVMLANPFGPAVRGWAAAAERLDFASSRMRDGEVTQFDELVRYGSGDLVVLHETSIGDRASRTAKRSNRFSSGSPPRSDVRTARGRSCIVTPIRSLC